MYVYVGREKEGDASPFASSLSHIDQTGAGWTCMDFSNPPAKFYDPSIYDYV